MSPTLAAPYIVIAAYSGITQNHANDTFFRSVSCSSVS